MGKRVIQDFPKYHLIVDDTGDGDNNKYHVGFLTPKMTNAELYTSYSKLKDFRDETIPKINTVIDLVNDILAPILGKEDLKIKNIDEIHVISITPLMKNYTHKLEKNGILPFADNDKDVLSIISKNPSFARFVEVCKAGNVFADEIFTGDNNQTIYDILNMAKYLIGDYFFEYAKNTSKFVFDNDLKIITSVANIDDKLLEGSQLVTSKNCKEASKNEINSYKNLCLNTLNYLSEMDNTAHLHLDVLCDNGIRSNTTDLHIYNHKELDPFSIKKITGSFQDSKNNYFLEAADVIAWMNNRFEKLIVKKAVLGKESNYLDKKMFELFTKYILPNFIESDYERLASVFQENLIPRKAIERNNRQYVDRVLETVLEIEK